MLTPRGEVAAAALGAARRIGARANALEAPERPLPADATRTHVLLATPCIGTRARATFAIALRVPTLTLGRDLAQRFIVNRLLTARASLGRCGA